MCYSKGISALVYGEITLLLFNNFSLEVVFAVFLVLFFSMGLHEYGHALMADWWGDDTPRIYGRLTPNPVVHINWVGFLMFAIIGFGILGSVPVNPRRMRDPRWGSFWTSFAGPLMNLGLALACAVVLRVVFPQNAALVGLNFMFGGRLNVGDFLGFLPDLIILILTVGIYFNTLLFVFNLLPFFPIDGWHILFALLPAAWLRREQVPDFIRQYMPPISRFLQEPAYQWQRWAQLSQFVLLALILLSFMRVFNPLGALIGQPTGAILRFLIGL